MNAKWLHSELSVLMIGLLLCLGNPIAAQERDTVIVVRRDRVAAPPHRRHHHGEPGEGEPL